MTEACPFTSRETEAVQMTAEGLTTKQIARRMSISHNVVAEYLRDARLKTSSPNKTNLVAKSLRRGWIN